MRGALLCVSLATMLICTPISAQRIGEDITGAVALPALTDQALPDITGMVGGEALLGHSGRQRATQQRLAGLRDKERTLKAAVRSTQAEIDEMVREAARQSSAASSSTSRSDSAMCWLELWK